MRIATVRDESNQMTVYSLSSCWVLRLRRSAHSGRQQQQDARDDDAAQHCTVDPEADSERA